MYGIKKTVDEYGIKYLCILRGYNNVPIYQTFNVMCNEDNVLILFLPPEFE